jgi:hypothetical protein
MNFPAMSSRGRNEAEARAGRNWAKLLKMGEEDSMLFPPALSPEPTGYSLLAMPNFHKSENLCSLGHVR